MATLVLWVWLLVACSVHASVVQVERKNLRPAPHLNLIGENRSSEDEVQCGVTLPVSAKSDMNKRCPSSCPLYVEDKRSDLTCDFACVANSVASCKEMNPMTPVPDLERGECRTCEENGCDECREDGTDRCAKCLTGYVVNSDGKCRFSGIWLVAYWVLYLLLAIVGIGVCFIIWWIVDLSLRKIHNQASLKQALRQRTRAKIHQPKQTGEERELWPYDTNMCREDVAGPAVRLLFNFQVALIVWALVLALGWWCLGNFVDSDMMILGTRGADTTRQACINVKWGHHTMRRTMWAKIGFLVFAYIFSFVGAIVFGIRQKHLYDHQNAVMSTHQDYAAILRGLPEIKGDVQLEKELQQDVVRSTQERPVGVSVGWQYDENCGELLQSAIFSRMVDIIDSRGTEALGQSQLLPDSPEDSDNEDDGAPEKRRLSSISETQKYLHRVFKTIEKVFVHPATQRFLARGRRRAGNTKDKQKGQNSADQGKDIDDEEVLAALHGLKSSSTAIVVFETSAARDNAVAIWEKAPLKCKDNVLRVEVPTFEPSAVLWQNLVPDKTLQENAIRVAVISSFVAIMIGLLCLFEYGYYHVQLNQVFATGEEAISLSFILTTICVAGMMAVLCACSAEVADRCKFERVGSRETCFVVLYTFSVVLQVSLDLVIAYHIGKHLLDVNDIHTYDGKRIADMTIWNVHDFVHVFEAYAMQKQLGVTVLSFGFPCAFLVPFLLEPIISIWGPYKLMCLIIRSHPEIKPQAAEGYLEAVPMDLGRYGDILINAVVGSLILWFPGGFTYTIFMFLACSHLYIYVFDHLRVLRSVQSIYISSFNADWVAQNIFALPCAIIAAALVFKSNCNTDSAIAPYVFPTTQLHHLGLWGSPCDEGPQLVFKVCLTFWIHLILHRLALVFIVPFVSNKLAQAEDPKEASNIEYKVTAQRYPCSWFSANLVHCLRSEFIYDHKPPFDYCVSGKEYLMRYNEDIGAYYTENKQTKDEDYLGSTYDSAKDLVKEVRRMTVTSLGMGQPPR